MDVVVTNFLDECWDKGIALNPDKFQMSPPVEFKGFELESTIDETEKCKTHIYTERNGLVRTGCFQVLDGFKKDLRWL